ncbi:hypothetical protein V1264_024696 [Littorina saxatilis]|uniref:Uncharacterized protein n=1 Tax=Littorina saxatilis TaxID=31220 RepID=A0AAN9AM67_9CAEN
MKDLEDPTMNPISTTGAELDYNIFSIFTGRIDIVLYSLWMTQKSYPQNHKQLYLPLLLPMSTSKHHCIPEGIPPPLPICATYFANQRDQQTGVCAYTLCSND